jgi:hypothetical protein
MGLVLRVAGLDADAAQHGQFAKSALNALARLAEFFAARRGFEMDALQSWIYHGFTIAS